MIVRRIEPAVVDQVPDRSVEVRDQPVVVQQSGADRQQALGDRKRDVGPGGVAPLGDDAPAGKHQSLRRAARSCRPDDVAERRRLAEGAVLERAADVPVEHGFMLARMDDRSLQASGIEPGIGGLASLPSGSRVGTIGSCHAMAP